MAEKKFNVRNTIAKKGGRPKAEFDTRLFEDLCKIHCTIPEMRAIMHTDERKLDDWCRRTYGESFAHCRERFMAGGKASLRRNQLRLSTKNAAAAIWCGKQLLGQRDTDKEPAQDSSQLLSVLQQFMSLVSENPAMLDKLDKKGDE